eukprot:gene6704-7412_t
MVAAKEKAAGKKASGRRPSAKAQAPSKKRSTATATATAKAKLHSEEDNQASDTTRVSRQIKHPKRRPEQAEKEEKREKKAKAASSTAKKETSSSSSSCSKRGRKPKVANSAKQEEVLYFVEEKKPHYYDEKWLGNEDETGSVCSGILEEDFCLLCGLSTLSPEAWKEVILCDRCDGEYHLRCLGLAVAPPDTFHCPRCLEDMDYERRVSFDMPGGVFQLAQYRKAEKKKANVQGMFIYTPARPLDAAWAECLDKGVMTVSRVFSYDLMERLLHGEVHKSSHKSGRVVDYWRGAIQEISQRLLDTRCDDMVDREGRYDLKLPDYVVDHLGLAAVLQPILAKLSTVMRGQPTLRTHDVVFAPVSSPSQKWHYDDCADQRTPYTYYTVLISLNPLDSGCGGTEIWIDKLNRGDLIRLRPGDALVFPGNLMHRGMANLGQTHRFFYYAAFACHKDLNAGQM